MEKSKSSKLWLINVTSFVLFLVLTATGLFNWLVLPRGPELERGFLRSLRHFLIDIHEWTALLFLVIVAVHVALHWGYVSANLKKLRNRN